MSRSEDVYESLEEEVGRVLVGNEDLVEHLAVALLTRGHVLLEGVPGVAKTTLANLFAEVTGLEYNRIQMTPDILPADITGTRIYRDAIGEFDLQRGPVFSNVVVADEINRATPKAQSALLEAMQEGYVTIDGETLPLPDPFMIIATQNPIEMEGTFELPEAQRDRFQFKLIVDLPEHDDERELLDRFDRDPTLDAEAVSQVVTTEQLLDLREQATEVYVDDAIKEYILALVEETRNAPAVEVGVSPRASLTLLNAAKARAAIRGRNYIIPGDIKPLVKPVFRHRLVLTTDAELTDQTPDGVIDSILDSVPIPEDEISNATDSTAAADEDRSN